MLWLLATTLYFDISPYEADSTLCNPDYTRIERVSQVRLYGAPRYYDSQPYLIRARSAYPGPDTLNVEDSGGWSYWVAIVDSAGNQTPLGCCPAITVGVSTVGVDPTPRDGEIWLDIMGRRYAYRPTKKGIYWVKRPGQRPRVVRIY